MKHIHNGMDDNKCYWSDWSQIIIETLGLKLISNGEFHGGCPNCGGVDRFWIVEKEGLVKVHCRQCNDFQAIIERMRDDGVYPKYIKQDCGRVAQNLSLNDFDKVMLYHELKNVDVGHAKMSGNNLVVPIYKIKNRKLEKVGAQTIDPKGVKKFTAGMTQEAAFHPIDGKKPEGTTYICEGFATAASVYQSTDRPAIFALNSGNLPKAAAALQLQYPDVNFVVAADNDEAGIKAAKKSGLPYKAPKLEKADWNDIYVNEGPLSVKKQLGKIRKPKPLFVPIGDLTFQSPDWIIDGLLETNTFSVCFGAPAAGKTFLVLDMALCIASGRSFHGNAVKAGPVFYIAGEGHNGFARRAAAWSVENNTLLKGLPFFKSSRSIILTDEASVDEMLAVVDEMAQEHGDPALVVVDTLARALGAADENSTKDMGAAITAVDDIRDAYDCTVLAVHHTGHGHKERARGSSALLGAVDAEFRVEKWSGDDPLAKIEVIYSKMKDAKIPPPMNFAHKEIDLIGADLEPAQSVVLEPIDGRQEGNNEDYCTEIVKAEFQKLVELSGENSQKRRVLKENVAIELGVSNRTADRYIKTMVDDQTLLTNNNELQAGWSW